MVQAVNRNGYCTRGNSDVILVEEHQLIFFIGHDIQIIAEILVPVVTRRNNVNQGILNRQVCIGYGAGSQKEFIAPERSPISVAGRKTLDAKAYVDTLRVQGL